MNKFIKKIWCKHKNIKYVETINNIHIYECENCGKGYFSFEDKGEIK